jgi:hypothetical protein
MLFELSLFLCIVLATALVAVIVRRVIPKIELRGHSETHNGIRVREVAFTWLRGKSANQSPANPRWLECVVYVTLKNCNQ